MAVREKWYDRGLYILKYSPLGGGHQQMSFGGKNMKRRRDKGGKCKRKGKKRERKGSMEKENEKTGSKNVK
jgi:hypothetical protein